MPGATKWDVVIELMKEYGLVGLILVYAMFNHYNNLTYEREVDAKMVIKLNKMDTKLEIVDYKLDLYNSRLNNLESRMLTAEDDTTLELVYDKKNGGIYE
jgi:hypothetical protein